MIRAALIAAECRRFPQRLAFLRASLCIRKLGRWLESAWAAVPLARVPRSRAPGRLAVLLSGEENGTSCVKDLGYGNNTVP